MAGGTLFRSMGIPGMARGIWGEMCTFECILGGGFGGCFSYLWDQGWLVGSRLGDYLSDTVSLYARARTMICQKSDSIKNTFKSGVSWTPLERVLAL